MTTNRLTNLRVKNAMAKAKAYRLSDGGSLFLEVSSNGSRLWRYRYRIAGCGAVYALGAYPEVSLEAARSARDVARDLVRRGVHPVADKKSKLAVQIGSNESTFQAVADRMIESKKACTAKYRDQIKRDFVRYVYPQIGLLPLAQLKAPNLLPVITEAAEAAPSTANNLRIWCSQVFRFGALYGLTESDPTQFLKGLVVRPRVKHNKSLELGQLPTLLHKLENRKGSLIVTIAIKLMALTFVRTTEMRSAQWNEINFDTATWTIPATRMKMRQEHIVPLSAPAIELLQTLRSITGQGTLLFPNRREQDGSRPMSATTINRALDYMGYRGLFSGHGFRSTATSALGALSYPADRVDLQLAHCKRSKDSTRAAYDHVRWLKSRRVIMEDWSAILEDLRQGVTVSCIFEKYGPTTEARQRLFRVVEVEGIQ